MEIILNECEDNLSSLSIVQVAARLNEGLHCCKKTEEYEVRVNNILRSRNLFFDSRIGKVLVTNKEAVLRELEFGLATMSLVEISAYVQAGLYYWDESKESREEYSSRVNTLIADKGLVYNLSRNVLLSG